MPSPPARWPTRWPTKGPTRWPTRLATLAALWWLALSSATARAGELRIDFLDVGQGDAALITSPAGKTVLVDGGPPEAAERLCARLLRLHAPLDLVVLSHRHLDHLGGLARVIATVGARSYLDAPFPHPSREYTQLMTTLAARGVKVRDAVAGRVIDLGGGATITLLGPPSPSLSNTRSDVNANSVVLRVDYGTASALFFGDAEAPTERWLLDGAAAKLRARIVKVAHHGSRFASTPELVAAVSPEIAVVSAGAGNSYHHPAPSTVARWEAAGARVLRTDRDGEVSVISDGVALRVITEHAPALEAAAR
jgi:competence protein ComEC